MKIRTFTAAIGAGGALALAAAIPSQAMEVSTSHHATRSLSAQTASRLAAQGLACNVNSGGPGCFTDNIIPANRLNSIGMQMLSLFPLPNANDPTGQRQFNYQVQLPVLKPRNDQVLRVDYNVAQGTTFYSRLQFGHEVGGRG